MKRLKVAMRIAVLALLGALCCARAQALAGGEVEIVDWGTYAAHDQGKDAAPETTSGYVRTSEMGPMHRTDVVDACVGTRFGIRYRLADPDATEVLPVAVETAHPPFPGRDGAPVTIERWHTHLGSDLNGAGWVFEAPYELVPGQWTISITRGSETLASKAFTIRTPETCDKPVS